MKQKYLLLYLLCLFTAIPFGAKAQSTRTYMFNFHKNDFTVETLNGDTCFLSSTLYDLSSEFDPTLPDLPVVYVNFLLPPDSTCTGFTSSQTATSYINNILLTNCSEIVSFDGPSVPSGEWYPQTTYNPGVEFMGSTVVSGYQVATFKIKPCKYYANQKKLFFYRFTISLDMQPTTVVPRNGGKRGSHDRAQIEKQLWNKDSLDVWYPWDNTAVYPIPSEDGSIPKDRYIIVTNNTLKPAFQPLIEWKRMKGLDAEIITRETINASPTVSADTGIHKIKHYLKNLYDNDPQKDDKDFYLLLGGDVNIVPTAYCFSYHPDDVDTYAPLPCDMYYGCFENNWMWDKQTQRNNVLGEHEDSVSVKNNMYVGRASVRNTEQANVFVNKIIQYEANPPLNNNWGDKLLYFGYMPDNMCPLSSSMDTVINQVITPNWNGFVGKLFVEYALLPSENPDASINTNLYNASLFTSGTLLKGLFTEQMRKDYSLVIENSHGEHNEWQFDVYASNSMKNFFSSDADTIQSAFPKIIETTACYTNGFDRDENLNGPSLSESFMRNPINGVVAYIGSSRQGYGKYVSPQAPQKHYVFSILFNRRYIAGLFQLNIDLCKDSTDNLKVKHLGKLVDYAKRGWSLKLTSNPNKNDGIYTNRKLYFAVNTLGDPEMPIYTQHPMLFDNVTCQVDSVNNRIVINTNVTDTKIYVLSTGKLYETAGMTYELPMMDKDSIEFVLTKQNYVPTLFTPFKTTKYIQNETISENTMYSGYDYIRVGRNVDITKPLGNVVVNSGKSLNLKANKEIEIRNNFEVPLGAEFILDIDN